MPTAFVSYSWDPEPHPTWVRGLSSRLRGDGVDTTLDQWHAVPGDNLPHFMERALRENDHVLVVCTPFYKVKSDARRGGVGYEGDIMTGEAFALQNRRKFIPVLREGEWRDAAPSWLLGSYYVDLRGHDWEVRYPTLLDTIHLRLPVPPPVQAQGFKYLPDKSVLDPTTNLLWSNCRSTDLVVLEEVAPAIEELQQSTGWAWRLPSTAEIEKVKAAEEYYPRPPILVELQSHHPFFGNFKKEPWTDERVGNVRTSDRGNSGGVFGANGFVGGWPGLAASLNVDAGHMASEAESLRRRYLLRPVREATPEDHKSVVPANEA